MKNKIKTFVVSVSYRVLTKDQAKELTDTLHQAYKRKVHDWTNPILPENWGKVNLDGVLITKRKTKKKGTKK